MGFPRVSQHVTMLPTSACFLLFMFLISSANAQVFYHRRRSSIGRIIAGCVVAGLFAIFLCFLVMMMRRRRQRQRLTAVTTQGGIPPNIQLGNKPMFSGPWGQATTPSNQAPISAYDTQGQNYNQYNNAAQYPSNSDYPNQSPLPPPPAYGQGANNHGYPAAPPGHPPHAQGRNSDQPYSKRVDPPQPAHTTNQDDSFVGGFRK